MYCCKNAVICFLKLQLSRMRGKLDLINYAYKLLQGGGGQGGGKKMVLSLVFA